MKRIVTFFAIAISILSFSAEASARTHRHHRHHGHHRHHVHHGHHRHHQQRVTVPIAMAAPSIFSFHQSKGAAMLAEAERWIGSKNPTGFRGPWCGAFQAMVARKVGVEPPSGYLQAKRWLGAGKRLSGPAVGAIAVLLRKGGGHVGVVAGIEPNVDPLTVSGNHNRRVGLGIYPKSRVLAYVEP